MEVEMIFDLLPIDWSGIAAIVSFVMVILTGITLCHNRKQLKELKRQWEAQNTPIVSCSLKKGYESLILDIHNSSQVPAHKVKVQLANHSNEEILHFDETNDLLKEMSFEIQPFSSKQIPIWITPFVDGDYDGYLSVELDYSGRKESFDLYLKEINLTIMQYTNKEICKQIENVEDAIKKIK
jgi:hypothetical protein